MPRSRSITPLPSTAIYGPDDDVIGEQDLADAAERSFDPIPRGLLIPIARIDTWDQQPRRTIDDAGIAELAGSIAATGLLEPLVVRRSPGQPGRYVIVAGHRRLLAARRVYGDEDPATRARVDALPCVVREIADDAAFADALVENLVRADLTRREVMDAVRRLQEEYGWSGREIAKRTGRSAGDIGELLRVAKHPQLARLVGDDALSPTAAGVIERMPDDVQREALRQVAQGALRTAAQAEELLAARRTQRATHEAGREPKPEPGTGIPGGNASLPDQGVPAPASAPARAGRGIHEPSETEDSTTNDTAHQVYDIIHLQHQFDTSTTEEAESRENANAAGISSAVGAVGQPDARGEGELIPVAAHTRRARGSETMTGEPAGIADADVEDFARSVVGWGRVVERLTSGQRALLRDALGTLLRAIATVDPEA